MSGRPNEPTVADLLHELGLLSVLLEGERNRRRQEVADLESRVAGLGRRVADLERRLQDATLDLLAGPDSLLALADLLDPPEGAP